MVPRKGKRSDDELKPENNMPIDHFNLPDAIAAVMRYCAETQDKMNLTAMGRAFGMSTSAIHGYKMRIMEVAPAANAEAAAAAAAAAAAHRKRALVDAALPPPKRGRPSNEALRARAEVERRIEEEERADAAEERAINDAVTEAVVEALMEAVDAVEEADRDEVDDKDQA